MMDNTDDQVPIISVEENYQGASLCNPFHWIHRWFIVLPLICLLSFGSYLCYDNPGALQDQIEHDMKVTVTDYTQLYAFYSWPNVVLPLIGGFLIDRVFGIRLGAIIFAAFVTAGQVVFGFGSLINSYIGMIAGRFVFGIGGESLAVAQNTYAVEWFKNDHLNLVFGLQLSFSRVGSTVNFWIMTPIYKAIANMFPKAEGYTVLGISLELAGFFCVLSLAIALIIALVDKRASKILGRAAASTGEVVRLKDIFYFPLSFWYICLICVFYYVAIFPFVGIAQVFFENKWNYDPGAADQVNSMVYLMSLFGSPVSGISLDYTGRNLFWIGSGVLITILCHLTLAFTFFTPWLPMIVMGLAYSILASALWPLVSLVIPEHQLGTAYGIMQAIQNLGLAVAAIVAGLITDTHGYLIMEIFFLLCLFLALICSSLLYLTDASGDGFLNMSPKQRQPIIERRKAQQSNPKAD